MLVATTTRARADDRAARRFDACVCAARNLVGVCVGIDATTAPLEGFGQTRDIFENVKLRLSWEAQRRAEIVSVEGNALDVFDIDESGAMRGAQFVSELFGRFAGRNEEIAVEPREITVDVFVSDDLFDLVNRRGVARGGKLRAAFAVEPFEFVVAFVERVDEMRGRARSLAPGDGAVVDDDHRLALLCEHVRRRHPRDARADDAHVRPRIFAERALLRHVRRGRPYRSGLPLITLHYHPPVKVFVVVAAVPRAAMRRAPVQAKSDACHLCRCLNIKLPLAAAMFRFHPTAFRA